jgi:3D (Asp-Asp-Asp) domain-containing protein
MNVLLFLLLTVVSEYKSVKTSIYNPTKAQCDADPTTTASGAVISEERLRKGKLRYVSLSRDLLKRYKYGTYLIVKSSNAYYNGKWKIVDTMNKRFKNKIDFLQHLKDKNIPPRTVKIYGQRTIASSNR